MFQMYSLEDKWGFTIIAIVETKIPLNIYNLWKDFV